MAVMRAACEAKGATMSESGIHEKRTAKLELFIVPVQIVVFSGRSEWELRLSVRIKQASLGRQHGLALLKYERMFFAGLPTIDDEFKLQCQVPISREALHRQGESAKH